MVSQTSTQEQETLREVSAADKTLGLGLGLGKGSAFCKMGEGWTCIITKTDGPDTGKVFVNCGENCTCTIEGEAVSQELNLAPDAVSGSDSGTFCKCGEGCCVIFRTKGPDSGSGKGFAECTGHCSCIIYDDKLMTKDE